MNRAAVGIGPWLLQQRPRPSQVSLDMTAELLEQKSYAAWLEEERNAALALGERTFLAVLDEIWREKLTEQEQAVLQGIFAEGKSASAVGRELGLHHSRVGRCKETALEKLRAGLYYVLRYRALLAENE